MLILHWKEWRKPYFCLAIVMALLLPLIGAGRATIREITLDNVIEKTINTFGDF